MKKNNNQAFTLTELIVVVVILGILSSMGFIYFGKYNSNARDVQRQSDIAQISSALKLYQQKNIFLPMPGNKISISNNGIELIQQGKFNNSVVVDTIDKLPLDPKTNTPYVYSVRNNFWTNGTDTYKGKQEFQLAATLENNGQETAIVQGNYKTVSKANLPTIVTTATSDTNGISGLNFIFNKQYHNLPYSFKNDTFEPVTDGSTTGAIIQELGNDFWQNSSYTSCEEIKQAGKLLGTSSYNYEILENGTFVNMSCE